MDAKITIVLPTFNGEENIRKSIDSIIYQSYTNWELILVNDCSTDNTLTILEEYVQSDSRIRLISNKINQKLPRSLNIGFAQASGELLTWTSDDNTYHSDALQVMSDTLRNHPDIDMVYADFNIVDLSGKILWEEKKKNPETLRFSNTVGACFLYRRSLADQIGEYDPSLFLAEDYEYWIRAYLKGNLMHIPQILYDYGWHDKSLTMTRKHDIGKATFSAKSKHFNALLNKCSCQAERNQFFWEMLNLLTDSTEMKSIRKQYYKLDHKFHHADLLVRLKSIYNFMYHLPLHFVHKLKSLVVVH